MGLLGRPQPQDETNEWKIMGVTESTDKSTPGWGAATALLGCFRAGRFMRSPMGEWECPGERVRKGRLTDHAVVWITVRNPISEEKAVVRELPGWELLTWGVPSVGL